MPFSHHVDCCHNLPLQRLAFIVRLLVLKSELKQDKMCILVRDFAPALWARSPAAFFEWLAEIIESAALPLASALRSLEVPTGPD